MTAKQYLSEPINYGGEMMARGAAYALLIAAAKSHGLSDAHARLCADRWMQGHDRNND